MYNLYILFNKIPISKFILFNILFYGIFILVLGIYLYLKRKPVIYTNKWYLLFIFTFFIPLTVDGIIQSYNTIFIDKIFSIIFVFPLTAVAVGILIIIFGFIDSINGYTLDGIYYDDFQKIITQTFDTLKYTYEFLPSNIKIMDPELELTYVFFKSSGCVQIKLEKGKLGNYKKIIHNLKSNIENNSTGKNNKASIFYLILGFILILGSLLYSKFYLFKF